MASWKNGLLENWPPRKLASLKFEGMEKWPHDFFGDPNVLVLFIYSSSLILFIYRAIHSYFNIG